MVGPFKKFVNIKKTMGPKGSLHKALGIPGNQKIGVSRLKQIAKGSGANAKKAELSLTLHRQLGKRGK